MLRSGAAGSAPGAGQSSPSRRRLGTPVRSRCDVMRDSRASTRRTGAACLDAAPGSPETAMRLLADPSVARHDLDLSPCDVSTPAPHRFGHAGCRRSCRVAAPRHIALLLRTLVTRRRRRNRRRDDRRRNRPDGWCRAAERPALAAEIIRRGGGRREVLRAVGGRNRARRHREQQQAAGERRRREPRQRTAPEPHPCLSCHSPQPARPFLKKDRRSHHPPPRRISRPEASVAGLADRSKTVPPLRSPALVAPARTMRKAMPKFGHARLLLPRAAPISPHPYQGGAGASGSGTPANPRATQALA